jgi:ABC-type iron transport system FetAB ATPase subunit
VLRCLNRLVEPTSGTVRFDGRDIRSFDPRELRRRVALVMQTPVMFEGTVRDNLCIRLSVYEVISRRGDWQRQGAATALGALLFVRMAAGRYLTPAHQLRRYML